MFDGSLLSILFSSALSVGLYIVLPVALYRLARRLIRALEQRSAAPESAALLADRVAVLEYQVEELARDNQRLIDQQQFAAELVSARADSRKDR